MNTASCHHTLDKINTFISFLKYDQTEIIQCNVCVYFFIVIIKNLLLL